MTVSFQIAFGMRPAYVGHRGGPTWWDRPGHVIGRLAAGSRSVPWRRRTTATRLGPATSRRPDASGATVASERLLLLYRSSQPPRLEAGRHRSKIGRLCRRSPAQVRADQIAELAGGVGLVEEGVAAGGH